MNYTTLYLLLAFIGLGIVIFLLRKFTLKKTNKEQLDGDSEINDEEVARPDDCCGAHEICEQTSLYASRPDIVYFNDEELDAYVNREPESYTQVEIDEFEEVFLTLRENELVEWLKSLQLRNIQLPTVIKEEAFMIIAEARKASQNLNN